MKKKISCSIALLFVAFFSAAVVSAQPGYHKDDNNEGRHDDRRNEDYNNNDRNDRDSYYHEHGGRYNDRDKDRYSVRHRPYKPYMIQSRQPSPLHVWISGDWVFSRGGYRYQPGYWMIPNRGNQFVEGHWERSRHGWYWVAGYWNLRSRW